MPRLILNTSMALLFGIFVSYCGPATASEETLLKKSPTASELDAVLEGFDDNTDTAIHYVTTHDGVVNLSIYDEQNNHIATVLDEFQSAGAHQVTWHGVDQKGIQHPDGKYYFQFSSPEGPIESNAQALLPGNWSSYTVSTKTSVIDSSGNIYDIVNGEVHKDFAQRPHFLAIHLWRTPVELLLGQIIQASQRLYADLFQFTQNCLGVLHSFFSLH